MEHEAGGTIAVVTPSVVLFTLFFVAVSALATQPQPSLSPADVHRAAIVVDGHNDVGSWILDYDFDLAMDGADPDKRNAQLYWIIPKLLPEPRGDEIRTHTDLDRLEAGGVDAQFFSVFAHPKYAERPGGTHQRAHDMIDALLRQVERHPERLSLALTAYDVRRNAAAGRISMLLGLEGGHAIDADLAKLRGFFDRGVRYMTLTWSNSNGWADASGDQALHGGLTDFGRDVVREMNRLGMVVDVSHVSDETFRDVMEVARAPVIASHSSARALTDTPRNMTDDMIAAVGKNGGVVMVNFGGLFIDPRKSNRWRLLTDFITHFGPSPTTSAMLVDHIDHIIAVAGIDHVGLGSDFDGTLLLPHDLPDVSGFPEITRHLFERGYGRREIEKVLGENTLRVLAEVEAEAYQLQNAPGA